MQSSDEDTPVAWRTFDGEGGYDYRSYDDNENYAEEWAKRNPKYVGWVEPLYTRHVPEVNWPEPVAWIVDVDLQRLGREGRLGVILNREQSTYGLSETPLYLHPAPEAKHDAAEKKEMK